LLAFPGVRLPLAWRERLDPITDAPDLVVRQEPHGRHRITARERRIGDLDVEEALLRVARHDEQRPAANLRRQVDHPLGEARRDEVEAARGRGVAAVARAAGAALFEELFDAEAVGARRAVTETFG